MHALAGLKNQYLVNAPLHTVDEHFDLVTKIEAQTKKGCRQCDEHPLIVMNNLILP